MHVRYRYLYLSHHQHTTAYTDRRIDEFLLLDCRHFPVPAYQRTAAGRH
jgi:hypothetical protein